LYGASSARAVSDPSPTIAPRHNVAVSFFMPEN
jgi:hypothetical protein